MDNSPFIERSLDSLEAKLPTIWTDKAAEEGGREEKEWEGEEEAEEEEEETKKTEKRKSQKQDQKGRKNAKDRVFPKID